MTTEKLELAKELNYKINKLKSFLHYYKDNSYRMSIRLENQDDNCHHREAFHFKEDDTDFSELIEEQLKSKLIEMKKIFNEL